jgi:hypothetical protein
MRNKPYNPALKKKERVQREKEFLSSLIADIDFTDLRRKIAGYPGVTWRHFTDKRHQALWRALETLDMAQNIEERADILMAASGRPPEHFDDNLGAIKDVYKQAGDGCVWLERCLAAADALPLVGGKVYVRELCEAYAAPLGTQELAKQLRFVSALPGANRPQAGGRE